MNIRHFLPLVCGAATRNRHSGIREVTVLVLAPYCPLPGHYRPPAFPLCSSKFPSVKWGEGIFYTAPIPVFQALGPAGNMAAIPTRLPDSPEGRGCLPGRGACQAGMGARGPGRGHRRRIEADRLGWGEGHCWRKILTRGAALRGDPSPKALSDSGPLRGPGNPPPAPPSLTPILTVNAVSPPCSTLSAANCFDWESARRLNAIDFALRAASIFKFPIDPSPKSP